MKKKNILILLLIIVLVMLNAYVYLPRDKETTNEEIEPAVIEDENQTQIAEDDLSEYERELLLYLEENFSSYGQISLDQAEKTYYIKPSDDKILMALEAFKFTKGKNDQLNNIWQDLVNELVKGSDYISQNLPGYSINILDPNEDSKSLLIVRDGQVIYDFTDDF